MSSASSTASMPHSSGPRTPWGKSVWPLAVAQTTGYASFYYIFPAFLPHWKEHLGWSVELLAGAFTLTLVACAVSAPVVGFLMDRGYARWVMTGAGVLGTLALIGLAFVTAPWQFYLCWALLGMAQAGCLYEPCFTVFTKCLEEDAKKAITIVTLVAGFASTLAFPTVHALESTIGWRYAVLIFVGIGATTTLLIFFGVNALKDRITKVTPHDQEDQPGLESALKQPVFWLITIAAAMIMLNHTSIITHLLSTLANRGLNIETAVIASAMIGPMQVMGRLAMMAIGNRASALLISSLSFLFMAIASLALLGAGPVTSLIVIFVICQGAGYGVTSITQPVLIAEVFGRRRYGAISGAIALPMTATEAAAPTLAAFILLNAGYDWMIVFTGTASVLGLIAILSAWRLHVLKKRREATSKAT